MCLRNIFYRITYPFESVAVSKMHQQFVRLIHNRTSTIDASYDIFLGISFSEMIQQRGLIIHRKMSSCRKKCGTGARSVTEQFKTFGKPEICFCFSSLSFERQCRR